LIRYGCSKTFELSQSFEETIINLLNCNFDIHTLDAAKFKKV